MESPTASAATHFHTDIAGLNSSTVYRLYDEAGTSTMKPKMIKCDSDDRDCLVCNDKSDGAHFGVDSCRACAAFFRRSVVMKKKYVCRQGTNRCQISKNVRCMCRKCRMRKCLEAGMLPESVQNKRDAIAPRRDEAPEQQPHSVAASDASSSENELALRANAANSLHGPQAMLSDLHLFDAPSTELIDKITINYRQLCAVRKSTELSLNLTSIHGVFEGLGTELVLGSSDNLAKIYRAQLPTIAEFMSNTFDGFALLDPDEKWSVFQGVVTNLMVLEGAFRTYKLIPNEYRKKRYVMSETTYFDFDVATEFFSQSVADKDRQDLANLLCQCLERTRYAVIVKFEKMCLTEAEYAVLVALCVFSQNVQKTSPKLEEFSNRGRTKIFDELRTFYSRNNTPDAWNRFGELFVIFCAVQHCTTRLREDFEIYDMFNAFAYDKFLYDFVKL